MTGDRPYPYIPRDTLVIYHVEIGIKPDRMRYLPTVFPDDLWTLMERCWNFNPSDRPNITPVREELEQM